jgi:hypothetical protein
MVELKVCMIIKLINQNNILNYQARNVRMLEVSIAEAENQLAAYERAIE